MKDLPSCSLADFHIPSFRAGFGLELQSQGSRFIPNHCLLCPLAYLMWLKEEIYCSQESNTDSADKFSSENDSLKASHNHLGPVGGSCLLDRIALPFWEGECLKKLNKTITWRHENLVIFVFAHKMLMSAGKKLVCTNVLSWTQNNEHKRLKKMHCKLKKSHFHSSIVLWIICLLSVLVHIAI